MTKIIHNLERIEELKQEILENEREIGELEYENLELETGLRMGNIVKFRHDGKFGVIVNVRFGNWVTSLIKKDGTVGKITRDIYTNVMARQIEFIANSFEEYDKLK